MGAPTGPAAAWNVYGNSVLDNFKAKMTLEAKFEVKAEIGNPNFLQYILPSFCLLLLPFATYMRHGGEQL